MLLTEGSAREDSAHTKTQTPDGMNQLELQQSMCK